MKKICLTLLIGALTLSADSSYCWFRLGNSATAIYKNDGDKGIPFAVSIGTTTPVKVYSSDARDREILIQSESTTYYLYCSTYSTVSSSSGNRFWVPPKPGSLTTNSTYSLWCILESAAGSSVISVLGSVDRDAKD